MVEPSQERTKWMTGYFSGVRALEKALGYPQSALHPEVRMFSVFHFDYPHTALGRYHTTTKAFTFDEEAMSALGITPGDVYKLSAGQFSQATTSTEA